MFSAGAEESSRFLLISIICTREKTGDFSHKVFSAQHSATVLSSVLSPGGKIPFNYGKKYSEK